MTLVVLCWFLLVWDLHAERVTDRDTLGLVRYGGPERKNNPSPPRRGGIAWGNLWERRGKGKREERERKREKRKSANEILYYS